MKSILVAFALLLVTVTLRAAETAPNSGRSGKSFEFDDLLVQGKYQFSNDSITTVEEDKVLDALLSVRKDFKDRVKTSGSRF